MTKNAKNDKTDHKTLRLMVWYWRRHSCLLSFVSWNFVSLHLPKSQTVSPTLLSYLHFRQSVGQATKTHASISKPIVWILRR